MTNPDLVDFLATQSSFQNRHSNPQGSLVALEPIPGDPGGSLWELDVVQEHQQVGPPGFVKEPWKGCKVGLIGGQDHKKGLKRAKVSLRPGSRAFG